jgi:hypothetical protein
MNENMLLINLKPKWIATLLNKWTNADYYYYEDKSVQDINDLCFGKGKNEEIKGIITG